MWRGRGKFNKFSMTERLFFLFISTHLYAFKSFRFHFKALSCDRHKINIFIPVYHVKIEIIPREELMHFKSNKIKFSTEYKKEKKIHFCVCKVTTN